MGRWKWEWEAIDPNNLDKMWTVGITHDSFEKRQHNGHDAALGRLLNVSEVLDGDYAIYEGWSRPGMETACFVYAGTPKRDHISVTIDVPAPPGMQFLIFVSASGAIEELTWRPAVQTEGETRPKDIKGKLIWPLTKN